MLIVKFIEILHSISSGNGQDLFFGRFTDQVKLYQQTSYTELTASLWLSLRLQVHLSNLKQPFYVTLVITIHMQSGALFIIRTTKSEVYGIQFKL